MMGACVQILTLGMRGSPTSDRAVRWPSRRGLSAFLLCKDGQGPQKRKEAAQPHDQTRHQM